VTLDEHLTCPKCGYDLYGIPEVRCPECDFRYDAAALRSTATSAEWLRLITARTVIVRSAVASALVLPFVLPDVATSPIETVLVLFILFTVYVASFLTWVILRDAYRGLVSIPLLLLLFFGVCLGLMFVLIQFPKVVPIVALLIIMSAWVARLSDWPKLHPRGNVRATGLRRSVVRHSVVGNILLIVASFLVAISLLQLGNL